MSLNVHIDGRVNLQQKQVSNALLRKLQKEDDHAQILNSYLASKEAGDGTYGFQGVINDPSKGITVPKAMLDMGSRAERVARVRDRMARKEPLKSLAYVEGYEVELLSTEDQEAYEEGWVCPQCLQYQAVPSSTCNWSFKGERPSDPKDWGCGYRRDLV